VATVAAEQAAVATVAAEQAAVATVAAEQAAVAAATAVAAAAAMTISRTAITPMVEGREIGATAERHHQHHTVHVDLLQLRILPTLTSRNPSA
jgi:hypothetical protein